MPAGSRLLCARQLRTPLVVVYAFVLAASGFFHHDLACHQQSRTHCVACSANQDAQKLDLPILAIDPIDRDAGRIEIRPDVCIQTHSLNFFANRAPPA